MFTKNNASKSLIDAVSSVIEKKPVVEEKTQPQVISEEQVSEVAPPGFEGTVKAMKKYKKIDNPFALAWSMKNKGYKSHKKADGSPKNEEVEQIDELKKSTLGSYIKKASKDTAVHGFAIGDSIANKKWATGAKAGDMAAKRISGIAKATDKLTKEESETVDEALKGDQHKIDKNHNKKIDAQDFRILRAKMKKEEVETVEEGWDDMVKAAKEKVSSGPKPSGGSGVKQGTRYGGSKQKDEPEEKKKN